MNSLNNISFLVARYMSNWYLRRTLWTGGINWFWEANSRIPLYFSGVYL